MLTFIKKNILVILLSLGILIIGIYTYIFLNTQSSSVDYETGSITIDDLMVLGAGESCNNGPMTTNMIIDNKILLCKKGYECSSPIDIGGKCKKTKK